MAFFPDLIGWSTETSEDWQKAAQYFFSRAAQEGTVIPAWSGTYHHDTFGGNDNDDVDIYCYHRDSDTDPEDLLDHHPDNDPYESPKDPKETVDHPVELSPSDSDDKNAEDLKEPLEVVIHMHMSGPFVWRLEPVYEDIDDLPDPYDHTMVVGLDNFAKDTVVPVEVISRHVLTPEEQVQPFLAQMCMLAKSVQLFDQSEDYVDAIQKEPLLALPPGSLVAPAFFLNRLQGLESILEAEDLEGKSLDDSLFSEDLTKDSDANDRHSAISPDEKLVILCAYVIGYEELELKGHPFLLRLQLTTPFGRLILFCNKAQINKTNINIGDICYTIGVLSADVAINEYVGGYGN